MGRRMCQDRRQVHVDFAVDLPRQQFLAVFHPVPVVHLHTLQVFHPHVQLSQKGHILGRNIQNSVGAVLGFVQTGTIFYPIDQVWSQTEKAGLDQVLQSGMPQMSRQEGINLHRPLKMVAIIGQGAILPGRSQEYVR